ncbi:hypothetical protein CBQ26_00335 [Deinococcus indicus]|uniref:Uncharacterized protein n=1 Tax=Deinococcus indicus TaxID=223556 RepID=A0A246BTD0_9DEIO|nr:hypothetical protein [Deinococcus indicus]OWL98939.1 hypothetical protein CBQ26_00335 [Deinococcus indicus]
MTPPALLTALRELAVLLPGGRLRLLRQAVPGAGQTETLECIYDGRAHRVCTISHEPLGRFGLLHVRASVEEEIQARGWVLSQDFRPHARFASARATIYTPNFHSKDATAPDHPDMDDHQLRLHALLSCAAKAIRNPHYLEDRPS